MHSFLTAVLLYSFSVSAKASFAYAKVEVLLSVYPWVCFRKLDCNLHEISLATFNDFEFPNEVDVVFRIHLGIKSDEPVLKDFIFDENLRNGKLMTIQMIKVNQPFVDSAPPTASAVRKFADDITNRTSRP